MAYFKLEPFGERARDLRHGIQTAALINRWRNKHERTYGVKEFVLNQPPAKPAESEDTLLDKLKALFKPLRK